MMSIAGFKNYLKLNRGIFLVLFFALLLRLFLSPLGTLSLDQNTFIGWSQRLVSLEFGRFYESWSDYLPGYLYVLWALGKLKDFLPIPTVILYKLPAIIADILTGFVVYELVRSIKNEKLALISAGFYLFNPAILANSTFWGQVDGLTVLFSLLSIYLLSKTYPASAASLAIGTLIKPQVAFVAPIVLLIMLKERWKLAKIVFYIGLSFAVFVLGFVPFNQGNLPQFIFERLAVSFSQYPYTSINAFNFWGIFGLWKPDSVISSTLGLIIIGTTFILSVVKLAKKKNSEYFLLAIVLSSTFFFLTRMHERHLLPVFAPLAILASLNPELWIVYAGLSITYVLNLFYSFNWITYDFITVFPPFVITFLILFNLALFIFLIYVSIREERLKLPSLLSRFTTKALTFPKRNVSPKRLKTFLVIVLAFSFITRVYSLNSPPNEYFDEVYHAFTAKQILEGNPKAWEWWNTPPEGFAYEWTHPPFAKEAMVVGMLIFGENSFGYRIPAAILGTGVIFLVYLIARQLFKDELVGILSAAVLTLDGLVLVMARIGMNDTYFLFFSLLSIYLFMKDSPAGGARNNFLSALSLGISLSSKWSAVWVIPILGILWLWQKRKFRLSYLWFLILPPLVYLASYIPMFFTGHGLDIFWGMQKQMWWYHTRLKATHAYMSSWWSWPIMQRPVYLYTSDEVNGVVARIYAIGNPLVFWFGLFSTALSFIYAFIERKKKLAFIIFSYLIFFVPWAASPRIMFLYHYLPSIPFLAIATGYVLRRFPKIIPYCLVPMALLFIYFYPHWAGLTVPLWLDKSYYWFSSWR